MSTYYDSGKLSTLTPGHTKDAGTNVTEWGGWNGVSVDNIRRTFNIGDYVAQLAPEQSLFFAYLSRVAKKPLDETVWKPLEYRPQWQRRNFQIQFADSVEIDVTEGAADAEGMLGFSQTAALTVMTNYDNTGKTTSLYNNKPIFLINGQIVRVPFVDVSVGAVTKAYWAACTVSDVAADGSTCKLVSVGNVLPENNDAPTPIAADYKIVTAAASANSSYSTSTTGAPIAGLNADCQVIGSAFAEASTAPDGWVDKISDAEFYMQIFKTAVPLMSGSAMATRYRGFADEYARVYGQHVMSHKMDIENAMLFGNGQYTDQDSRHSWGIVPFIELMGGKSFSMEYDVSGYDSMVDIMQEFFAPEIGNSGQKLCLTSRKVIAWLSKLGNASSGSFIYNSLGRGMGPDSNTNSNPYSVSVDVKSSKFAPVPITAVTTAFGTFNFVAHPLFRGHAENLCAVVDLANVAYRPLVGNGLNRDTYVETNIQDNSVDGRKDQIITECGLEIMLPETHALIKFS